MATTVSGIHPIASGYPSGLPLYTYGPALASGIDPTASGYPSGLTLFEHGFASISGIPTLYEHGFAYASGYVNLFEHGHIVISGGYQDDMHGLRGMYLLITGTTGEAAEEVDTSHLVTDTWADNLRLNLQPRTITKTLTVTPTTSGSAITQTVYFFNKNCPFNGKVLGIKAVARSLTAADFDGTGGAVSIGVQRSDEVDSSPSSPTTPSWDTLLSAVSCVGKSTDNLCFKAPGDGTNRIDQTYHTIPKGGSLRATLIAQVENTYSGDGSTVTIDVSIEYLPTDVSARYWDR
jgi:hypothetical protein